MKKIIIAVLTAPIVLGIIMLLKKDRKTCTHKYSDWSRDVYDEHECYYRICKRCGSIEERYEAPEKI